MVRLDQSQPAPAKVAGLRPAAAAPSATCSCPLPGRWLQEAIRLALVSRGTASRIRRVRTHRSAARLPRSDKSRAHPTARRGLWRRPLSRSTPGRSMPGRLQRGLSSQRRQHRATLLGVQDRYAESGVHNPERGNQIWGEPTDCGGGAGSFSASPTANPAGRQRRLVCGWRELGQGSRSKPLH
jgi:hypothetical protein